MALTAPAPLCGRKDGQAIIGSIATADGKFALTTQSAGVVTAAKESIQSISNKDEHSLTKRHQFRSFRSK